MAVLLKLGLVAASATLAVTTAATVGAPVAGAAPAHVDCGPAYYKVTAHHVEFVQVDEAIGRNHSNRPLTIKKAVGHAHKTTVKYGAAIDISAKAGFWKFGSASASVKGHYNVTKVKRMKSTFTAKGTAAPHSKLILRYGFSRYDQYIKHYTPYNKTINTCGVRVVKGWVDAPFATTFVASN